MKRRPVGRIRKQVLRLPWCVRMSIVSVLLVPVMPAALVLAGVEGLWKEAMTWPGTWRDVWRRDE